MKDIGYRNGISNILSMGEVNKLFRIVMDTSDGDIIKAFINCNKLIKFIKCGAGVYYHDTKEENKVKDIKKKVSFINTMRNNKKFAVKRS